MSKLDSEKVKAIHVDEPIYKHINRLFNDSVFYYPNQTAGHHCPSEGFYPDGTEKNIRWAKEFPRGYKTPEEWDIDVKGYGITLEKNILSDFDTHDLDGNKPSNIAQKASRKYSTIRLEKVQKAFSEFKDCHIDISKSGGYHIPMAPIPGAESFLKSFNNINVGNSRVDILTGHKFCTMARLNTSKDSWVPGDLAVYQRGPLARLTLTRFKEYIKFLNSIGGGLLSDSSDGLIYSVDKILAMAPITNRDIVFFSLATHWAQRTDSEIRLLFNMSILPNLDVNNDNGKDFTLKFLMEKINRERENIADSENVSSQLLEYVCVDEPNPRFLHLKSGSVTTPSGIILKYGPKSTTQFRELDGPHVHRIAWDPKENLFFTYENRDYVNTYKPITLVPRHTDDPSIDVHSNGTPYMDMIRAIGRRLCTSDKANEEFHQLEMHKAFCIQNIHLKPQWQVMMPGAPRTGKNLYFRDICSVLGSMATSLGAEDVKNGWGDYRMGKRCLIVDEVDEGFEKGFYTALKPLLVSGSTRFTAYNMKGQPVTWAPDISCLYLITNHINAVALDRNGDKLFIIESFSLPKLLTLPEYNSKVIEELVEWINDVGRERIYGYYLDIDLSLFSSGELPFVTEGLRNMVEATRTSAGMLLSEWVENPLQSPHSVRGLIQLDAIKVEDLLNAISSDENLKNSTAKTLQLELHALGAVRMRGQKRNGTYGTSVSFWVIRNHNNWKGLGQAKMYERFFEQEIRGELVGDLLEI